MDTFHYKPIKVSSYNMRADSSWRCIVNLDSKRIRRMHTYIDMVQKGVFPV